MTQGILDSYHPTISFLITCINILFLFLTKIQTCICTRDYCDPYLILYLVFEFQGWNSFFRWIECNNPVIMKATNCIFSLILFSLKFTFFAWQHPLNWVNWMTMALLQLARWSGWRCTLHTSSMTPPLLSLYPLKYILKPSFLPSSISQYFPYFLLSPIFL